MSAAIPGAAWPTPWARAGAAGPASSFSLWPRAHEPPVLGEERPRSHGSRAADLEELPAVLPGADHAVSAARLEAQAARPAVVFPGCGAGVLHGTPRDFGAAGALREGQCVGPGGAQTGTVCGNARQEIAKVAEQLREVARKDAVRRRRAPKLPLRHDAAAQDQSPRLGEVVGDGRWRSRVGNDRVHDERGRVAARVRWPRDGGPDEDLSPQVLG